MVRSIHAALERGTAFLIFAGMALFAGLANVYGAPPTRAPYPKTNLMSFLAQWRPTPATSNTNYDLEPQWVGTLRRVYLRAPEWYKSDKTNNIRFNRLMVSNLRDILQGIHPIIYRCGTIGYRADEAAVFMSNLPSAQAISEAKNLGDLHKMLGPSHGHVSAPFAYGWTCFTREGKDRLRCLNVLVHLADSGPPPIEILHVSEGIFRPANPNSAEEKAQFKTGDEVEAEEPW